MVEFLKFIVVAKNIPEHRKGRFYMYLLARFLSSNQSFDTAI